MRLSRALPLVLVALALLAPDAKAETYGEQIKRAEKIAYKLYPLPVMPTYGFELTPENQGKGVAAEAYWRGCQVNPPPGSACRVNFDDGWLRRGVSFVRLCSVLIHEWGHLHGWHVSGALDDGFHSADPGSNMYPIVAHHWACGMPDRYRYQLEDRRDNLRDRIYDLRDRYDDLRWVKAYRRARAVRRRIAAVRRQVAAVERRLLGP